MKVATYFNLRHHSELSTVGFRHQRSDFATFSRSTVEKSPSGKFPRGNSDLPRHRRFYCCSYSSSTSISSLRSTDELILAGAGFRGIEVAPGVILKVTSIGIYVEEELLNHLANRWRGKSSSFLLEDEDFFLEIISAQFEKCAKVALLKPLTGVQYSEKVLEHTKAELGKRGDAEDKAIQEFLDAFKQEIFFPGSSILLFVSPAGLTIAFTHESDTNSEIRAAATIDNRRFAEAVLGTILGKHSVSPVAKASVASRLSSRLSVESQESLS
ncbi:hypothetical protein O6H91_02G038100 [Diphasiastrum complanatum]|uniref:Uncharacterized protein n=1 Tax=Diphasiastrum complanatum TaxID=34168 RepID=A0ACC2EEH9_DIPCM|nr:hypothetical protein O6H91_02G038100 [Diphasiastrum complanatum]